jgi:hypothetical protein
MIKGIILFILSLPLFGCNPEITSDYLLENLNVLKQEVKYCDNFTDASMTAAQKIQCDIVMSTANNIVQLSNKQQADPQKFGIYVLSAEAEFSHAKVELLSAEKNIQQIKASDTAAFHSAQQKLIAAQEDYKKRQQEMKLLMAVLGIGSPE